MHRFLIKQNANKMFVEFNTKISLHHPVNSVEILRVSVRATVHPAVVI